jgi:hypothetical protein
VTERFALPASLKELRNYVDGEFVATSKTFDNVSPLHGKLAGQGARGRRRVGRPRGARRTPCAG